MQRMRGRGRWALPVLLAHALYGSAGSAHSGLPAEPTLPQDLFKSPAPGKDGMRVVLTPKSQGKALEVAAPASSAIPGPAGAQTAVPGSVAKSVPRTAGRSRLSQVGCLAALNATLRACLGCSRPCLVKAFRYHCAALPLACRRACLHWETRPVVALHPPLRLWRPRRRPPRRSCLRAHRPLPRSGCPLRDAAAR